MPSEGPLYCSKGRSVVTRKRVTYGGHIEMVVQSIKPS